jgi:hypothetical protein
MDTAAQVQQQVAVEFPLEPMAASPIPPRVEVEDIILTDRKPRTEASNRAR